MPEYTFTFDPAASGLDYVIRDRAGLSVSSGTLESDTDAVTLTQELPWGSYEAKAALEGGPYSSPPSYFATGSLASAGGGGGGGVTDGVGAVIFGGIGLSVPLNNTTVHCTLAPEDDPPRAPLREDLMILDPEDNTTLNVVRSGLYDISLNTPLGFADVVSLSDEGSASVRAEVKFEVNGENEPPAYDYNNRLWWNVGPAALADSPPAPQAANLTFPQVLLAGDTIQVGFKAVNEGLVNLVGTLTLLPDITLVITYRGPVELG